MLDSHAHLLHLIVHEGINKESIIDPLLWTNLIKYTNKSLELLDYILNIDTNYVEHQLFQRLKENIDKKSCLLQAYGIHPSDMDLLGKQEIDHLNEVVENTTTLNAIGEIGLDFFNDPISTLKKQETLFRTQIELAIKHHLPIIVHSRDAFPDTLRILKSYHDEEKTVIIHCYGYGEEEVHPFLEEGFYISFAGNLTFKKAQEKQEAFKQVPLDRLLLETDSPFLMPFKQKKREKSFIIDNESVLEAKALLQIEDNPVLNFPLLVNRTYRKACELKEIHYEMLNKAVTNNFKTIFKLS